jgi:hypothetical protein
VSQATDGSSGHVDAARFNLVVARGPLW